MDWATSYYMVYEIISIWIKMIIPISNLIDLATSIYIVYEIISL